MANNYTTDAAFTGKIDTTDPTNYPQGKARDITTPGDGTGTPWIAKLLNDIFGQQQALLAKAGIVPSGTPDTAQVSQYLQALDRTGVRDWNINTNYAVNDYAIGSNGVIYVAVQAQVGNDPVGDGGTNWVSFIQAATETTAGISAIATQAEVNNGTVPDKFVTPATLAGAASAGTQTAFKTGDEDSTGSYIDVTDLNGVINLEAGVNYIVEADIVVFGGNPAISGIDLEFTAASTASRLQFSYRQENDDAFVGKDDTGSPIVLTLTDAEMPNVVPDRSMVISGYIRSSAAQTLGVRFKRNNTSGTVTIRAGSWIKVTRA